MLNSYIVILVILLVALYFGSGFFGALLLSVFWRGWTEESSYDEKETDYDNEEGPDFKLFKPGDTSWLRVCQCLCVLFGPVVPCIIICIMFLVYLVYALLGIVALFKR